MKDDALPQNPGMCLPYTCGQRCHYMLRMWVSVCAQPWIIFFYAYKCCTKHKAGAPRSIRSGFLRDLTITRSSAVTTIEDQRFYHRPFLWVLSTRSDMYAFRAPPMSNGDAYYSNNTDPAACQLRPTFLASQIEFHLSFVPCCLEDKLLLNSDVIT